MPYIYQTFIELKPEDADHVKVGRDFGNILAYLKAVLPDEPGFVTARAMVSLKHDDTAHVVLESVWDNWESLRDHLEKSHFVESRFLPQFEMEIEPVAINANIYEEVE